MPSVLRTCIGCQGRFAKQYFSFFSETCRLCTAEKAVKDSQAENMELKRKVKILEEFVTAHIGVEAPVTCAAVTAQAPTPNTLPSSPAPEHVSISNNNFLTTKNGVRVNLKRPIMLVMTQNSFGPLADYDG